MRMFMLFFAAFAVMALLFWLTPVHEAPVSDAPDLTLPAFGACTTDLDCALVMIPCEGLAAVKDTQHKYVQDWYKTDPTRTACPMIPPQTMATAACVQGHCQVATTNEIETPHVP